MSEERMSTILDKTWNIEADRIPQLWKDAVVKLNRSDVPKDWRPGSRWPVTELQISKRGRKGNPQVAAETFSSLADNEEEEEISDNEGEWQPETVSESEMSGDFEEESIHTDFTDDEDPDWKSTKKKRVSGFNDGPQKTVKIAKTDEESAKKSADEIDDGQDMKDMNHRHLADDKTSGPCTLTTYTTKPVIVPQEPPSNEGGEKLVPNCGDFLLELDSVKNGYIPHLWRYKRDGLIQRYVRIEEKGAVLFKNHLNFSDWWSCYSNKYVKIGMMMFFKYRTEEKYSIKTLPDIEGLVPQTVGQSTSNSNEAASTAKSSEENQQSGSEETDNDKTVSKETEDTGVSSTTSQDAAEYQVGMFVMDKKELRNVDNFAIWRIQNGVLLKKYQMLLTGGKMVHKPMRVFRGYKKITSQYVPIKIRKGATDMVEVEEESRPKLFMDSSTEEQYEKNPLLRHFYVYLQVFLSQALEPGFLKEIYNNEDKTYITALMEIDRIIEQKMNQVERKVRWKSNVQEQLQKSPYLREVGQPEEKKSCEALREGAETVEEQIFLSGDKYDPKSLKPIRNSQDSHQFFIGKTAASIVGVYHQLCHFKYSLYDRCLAKVKMVRESSSPNEQLGVEDVMDECLGNKQWVLQSFEIFMSLIQR